MEHSAAELPSNRSSLFYLIEISKRIEYLKKKLKEKNKTNIEGSDLHVFKDLCTNADPKINSVACEVVVDFVKSNTFALSKAFTWFISIFQPEPENNHNGIIQVITDLLLLNDDINFNLYTPQHPFILVLKQNERNWGAIVFHLNYMYKYADSNNNYEKIFLALSPFFKYILWSPAEAVEGICKRGAWKFLVDNFRSENLQFLIETICWLPSNHSSSILDVGHFFSDYNEFSRLINENNLQDTFCVYYAYTSCKLAEYGHDPTPILRITKKLLRKYPSTTSIVLALIAQTLMDCPARFLNSFLLTCLELIKNNGCENVTVRWLVISAVLPWLIHSLPLIENACKTAELIFSTVFENRKCCERRNVSYLLSDKHFMQVIASEREMYSAFVIVNALENLSHSELLERFGSFQIDPKEALKHSLLPLCVKAIMLSSDDINIQIRALDVSMKIHSNFQLPVILHMLSREPNPKLKLKLLHALPLTAIEKDNVSAVLRSIDALFFSRKKILVNLSIEMYLILWKTEERCYSYLHDRLLEYKTSSSQHIWDKDVVMVSAIRSICTIKPERYGKEWISTLNEIIQRWHKKKDSSVPSALALDAILILCKAEVLEVISIYKLLSEHLFGDKRLDVVKKFCALTEHMFAIMNKDNFEKFEETFLQAVSRMWIIVSTSTEREEILSAIRAISKFNVNEMPLKVIPEIYRKHVKLPQSYIKTSIDRTKKPEDVLRYVPGDVWICMLQNMREDVKPNACEMLIYWLRDEVENFPRSLYGSIRGEPKDLNFLHDRCIYKALVNYLKTLIKRNDSNEENLEMGVMCLRILNGDLPKTLPLLSWSFLLQLLETKKFELIEQVITLFARQSRTSSSARICMENYLKDFHVANDKEDELKVVLEIMTHLCYGISNVALKIFLDSVKDYLVNKIIQNDKSLLIVTCNSFKKALKKPDIEENNRICIAECVEFLWENTSPDDDVFVNLVNVATELPTTYVDHLSSPSVMWDLSCDKVRKLIKLRCYMALKTNDDNPFVWLQECVEATSLYLQEQELYFQYSLEVLKKYRLHPNCWQWLLQYMNYIISIIDELSEAKKIFICDVFIFCIVNLSIYGPFVSNNYSFEEYSHFFPQALNGIITDEVSSQVIEWLHRMIKSVKINQHYRPLFYNGIVSVKNNKYLSNVNVWCKVLS